MLLTAVVSCLVIYFALFLGVSGLAKLDRPLMERDRAGSRMTLTALLFSPTTSRALGGFEVALAILLALGIEMRSVVIVNAVLFAVFWLVKLSLLLTGRGGKCGCFGAHEIAAVDLSSAVASTLVLGLAIVLAVLAQQSSADTLNWMVGGTFLMAFGWIVLRIRWRRRWENQALEQISAGAVIE